MGTSAFTVRHPIVPGADQEVLVPNYIRQRLPSLQTASWPEGNIGESCLGCPACLLGHPCPLQWGIDHLFPLTGVLKFARLVKSYEAQDPEIASLSGKLKALFLPPMTLPPHGPAAGGSVAAS